MIHAGKKRREVCSVRGQVVDLPPLLAGTAVSPYKTHHNGAAMVYGGSMVLEEVGGRMEVEERREWLVEGQCEGLAWRGGVVEHEWEGVEGRGSLGVVRGGEVGRESVCGVEGSCGEKG